MAEEGRGVEQGEPFGRRLLAIPRKGPAVSGEFPALADLTNMLGFYSSVVGSGVRGAMWAEDLSIFVKFAISSYLTTGKS